MTFLAEAALRSAVPLVAALLACALLRRRSAALRHRVLAAGVAGAAAVVPLAAVLPSWSLPAPVRGGAVVQSGAMDATPSTELGPWAALAPSPAARPASIGAGQALPALWLAGAALGAAIMLLRFVRLVRLTGAAVQVSDAQWRRAAAEIAARYGISRKVVLLNTRAPAVIATWGFFTPRVLLPAQAQTWSAERTRVALSHELAHIRRGDWPVQVGAEILRILLWFNPLIWMVCARLRREAEQACDDMVLGRGIEATTYASHLLDIARECRPAAVRRLPALAIARPSTLERRITAMLNARVNRQVPGWRALAAVVLATVGLAGSSASLGVSAQAPGPGSLTGYIYDGSGGVLPGVEVTLTGGGAEPRSAVTDATGRFALTAVGPGTFVLEAALPGFRTLRNEFTLRSPRDWTRNITMQVGEVEETIFVVAKRPAQTVPLPRSTTGSNPVRVGGNIKAPQKLKHANPVYPPAMRDAGLEGLVPMDALIGRDGTVASVRVLSAEIHPDFVRAAEDAVRRWVFTPTLLNGVPVEVEMAVSIKFSLED